MVKCFYGNISLVFLYRYDVTSDDATKYEYIYDCVNTQCPHNSNHTGVVCTCSHLHNDIKSWETAVIMMLDLDPVLAFTMSFKDVEQYFVMLHAVFCPHWSAVVITDHHSAAFDQYSPLPDHHSFYQYIYRSSLSSYARVAIVYLHVAIFFSRPMGHGSSHARSRSTQLHAMIESSENVNYIEPSNLWVGKAQGARACVLRIIQ